MLNIIIFGSPGSGKGTQSEKIVTQFELMHLSTGEMLRFEMDQKTDLGEKIREGMDNGEYVSDELALQLIKKSIDKAPNAKGFVFDGFPRTIKQAQALDILLAQMNTSISVMIALEVSENELVIRLTERSKISGRGEDQGEKVIKKRLDIYNQKTKPLMNYYKEKNKLQVINGIGSVNEIFKQIRKEIACIENEQIN